MLHQNVVQENFKKNCDLIDTIDIKCGNHCESCKIQLKSLENQYYCYFCNIWFCNLCGDKDDPSKLGNDRLVHPHNMVWINVKNEEGLSEIEKYKFGENRIFKENIQKYSIICNCYGCKKDISNCYRYVCLNCFPMDERCKLDLCQSCMNVLRDENLFNSIEYLKIVKGLKSHDLNSHVWLRICYGKNYGY